ncbi:hypothetical protein GCM10025777_19640 [Membranihabitans marinus]
MSKDSSMDFDSTSVLIDDLSAFQSVSSTWSVVGNAWADLYGDGQISTEPGTGIIVNKVSENQHGKDLVTKAEFGDLHLSMEYMMTKGGNSGIYLQGLYEIQLLDSWMNKVVRPGDNGGLYNRWDESRPDGNKGYGGRAPRWNVSKAPGLWQHLDIVFRAPRFDDDGNRTEKAILKSVRLNGVLIHDNVQLSGPTRGSLSGKETSHGPLRIQGDHGSLALRNISLTPLDLPGASDEEENRRITNPIYLEAKNNTVHRSFMDVADDYRVTRSVSVGSPEDIHYSYDMDCGNVFQVWRGPFLNTTPMWHSRGDGSARPQGGLTSFGYPVLSVAVLENSQSLWPTDTLGTGFRPMGYRMTKDDLPIFTYKQNGVEIHDQIGVLENREGLLREISTESVTSNLFHQLASASMIEKVGENLFLIGDHSYYIAVDSTEKPIIREDGGKYSLIIPLKDSIKYSILF